MERLQKVIASSGYTSRRKAEELIKDGKVTVNGKTVTEMGLKVEDKDSIVINGMELKREEKEYYLLYKPRGVISSVSDDKRRKTVVDLIDTSARIYPVGRLDYDTSGIIILTNDGDLANIIMHPKNEIDKKYLAKITGKLTSEEIYKIKGGVVFRGEKLAPAKVKVKKLAKDNSLVEVIIHEGQNHQIKNMFSAVGHDVEKLKRESIAFLDLKGLNAGDYRILSVKEVKTLYSLENKKS